MKEIVNKIKRIHSTKKITHTMQLVAAKKLSSAKQIMLAARAYPTALQTSIANILQSHPDYQHPFLTRRPTKSLTLIIVSSDRGLCDGLNNHLFKQCWQTIEQSQQQKIPVKLITIGQKSFHAFKHLGVYINIQAEKHQSNLDKLIGLGNLVAKMYMDHETDRVFLAYNRFVNTITRTTLIEPLLPILHWPPSQQQGHTIYLCEPSLATILPEMLQRYLEALLLQATRENTACEHAARMLAMKQASDNAQELTHDLKIIYNKFRQASITKELTELIAGDAS
jgi:F-type H+-transporting ATPase subunit gamma